jgi:hypothetical protein
LAIICENINDITTAMTFIADNDLKFIQKIVLTSHFSIKESPEILYDNYVELILARSTHMEPAQFIDAADDNLLKYTSYANQKTLKFQVIYIRRTADLFFL